MVLRWRLGGLSVAAGEFGAIVLMALFVPPVCLQQFGATFSATLPGGGAIASAGGVTAVALLPQLNVFGVSPFGGMQNPYYRPQTNFNNNPYGNMGQQGWIGGGGGGGGWSAQPPYQQQQQSFRPPPANQFNNQGVRPGQGNGQQLRPQQHQQQQPHQQQQQHHQQQQQQQQHRPQQFQQQQQQQRPLQQQQQRPQQPQQPQQQRPQQPQQQQPQRPQQQNINGNTNKKPNNGNVITQKPNVPSTITSTIAPSVSTPRPTVSPDLIASIFNTTPQPPVAVVSTVRPTVSPDLIASIFNATPQPQPQPPAPKESMQDLINNIFNPTPKPSQQQTEPSLPNNGLISQIVEQPVISVPTTTPATHQAIKRQSFDFIYPDSPLYVSMPVSQLIYGDGIEPRRK